MKKPVSKAKLTGIALRFLTVRPRFEAEIRAKLASHTNNQKMINQIIARLKTNKFLDDHQLAFSTARHLLETKSKGPFYIRQKLSRLGVDKDLIIKTLDSLDQDSIIQAIKKIITTRFKSPQQIIRLLTSRGFTWAQISPFIDEIRRIA